MLIRPEARSEAADRQGRRCVDLAELRRQLARPSSLRDGHRQRLLDLARRLARVQALADEHVRVDFSEYAKEALTREAVAG